MGVHTKPAKKRAELGHVLRFVVAPMVFIVIGLVVMMSPVIMTHLKNADHAEMAERYSQSISGFDRIEIEQEEAEAHAWNERQDFRIAGDPWMMQPDPTSDAYVDYLSQLDPDPVMARLKVPSISMDLPVYHGTEESTLALGVGHLFGTALPVGGAGTHSVLTGHTGISTATLFDNLVDVQIGELMAVETLGEQRVYRVSNIETVLPEETETIRPVADQDLLTLITCTPYGINSHRLLVTGERIYGEEAAEFPADVSSGAWQWWMYLALGLSVLIVIATALWLLRQRGNRK